MGEAKRRDDAIAAGVISACRNCRFWKVNEQSGGKVGICRRLPPTVLIVGMQQNTITRQTQPLVDSFHPLIPAEAWCGEWAPSGKPVFEIDENALAEGLGTDLAATATEGTA